MNRWTKENCEAALCRSSFEQADPVGSNPQAAAAAGIVAQYDRDREFALKAASLQQQGAAGYAGRVAASQAQNQQAQLQAGQQQLAANAQAQQPLMQQQQFAQQQALVQQQGQQQAALQQQRSQLGVQAQQQEYSFQDNIRLQQLKASQSRIDALGPDGTNEYSAEEVASMKSMLAPGITVLQARKEQADLQRQQQQTQQLMDAHAKATATEQMASAFRAKTIQQRTATVSLPDGRQVTAIDMGPDKPMHILDEHLKHGTDAEAEAGFDKDWHEMTKSLTTKDENNRTVPPSPDAVKAAIDAKNQAKADYMQSRKPKLAPLDELAGIVKQYPDAKGLPPAVVARVKELNDKIHPPAQSKATTDTLPPTPRGTTPDGQVIPPGMRTDAAVPGYILPSHWREGEHYRVKQGANGPEPEVIQKEPELNWWQKATQYF